MKKIILGVFVFLSFVSHTQDYKFGAGFANGIFFKMEGGFKITDKEVVFEVDNNGKTTTTKYQVVKNVNGLLYITDGVMTHFLTFTDMEGKKKGFEYDCIVVFNFDKSQSISPVNYYCKKNYFD